MAVRVRLFAALREAAGTGELEVAPGPLDAVLDGLRARFGERFAALLRVSSVLVDGTPVDRDAYGVVADGAELALLPPVSGGAQESWEEEETRPPWAGERQARATLPPPPWLHEEPVPTADWRANPRAGYEETRDVPFGREHVGRDQDLPPPPDPTEQLRRRAAARLRRRTPTPPPAEPPPSADGSGQDPTRDVPLPGRGAAPPRAVGVPPQMPAGARGQDATRDVRVPDGGARDGGAARGWGQAPPRDGGAVPAWARGQEATRDVPLPDGGARDTRAARGRGGAPPQRGDGPGAGVDPRAIPGWVAPSGNGSGRVTARARRRVDAPEGGDPRDSGRRRRVRVAAQEAPTGVVTAPSPTAPLPVDDPRDTGRRRRARAVEQEAPPAPTEEVDDPRDTGRRRRARLAVREAQPAPAEEVDDPRGSGRRRLRLAPPVPAEAADPRASGSRPRVAPVVAGREAWRFGLAEGLGAGLFVAGVGAAAAGGPVLSAVVLVLGLLVLADLVVLMDRGARRPAPLVTAVAGLGAPLLVAAGVRDPGTVAAVTVAVAVVTGFAWLIAVRRPLGSMETLGATLLATTFLGMGAAALLLLRALPGGALFAALAVVLPGAVEVADAVARRAGLVPAARLAAAVLAPAAVAALVAGVAGAPGPTTTALLWLTAVAGGLLAAGLHARLRADGGLRAAPTRAIGDGALLAAVDGVLLTAPLAYLVVAGR